MNTQFPTSFSIRMPDKNTTQQLLFQLGGTLLTIVGLSYTMTQPTLQRIDELRADMIELKTKAIATDQTQSTLERRLTRIETDLYRLRQEYPSVPATPRP